MRLSTEDEAEVWIIKKFYKACHTLKQSTSQVLGDVKQVSFDQL